MIKENTGMRNAYDIIMDQKKEMIDDSEVGMLFTLSMVFFTTLVGIWGMSLVYLVQLSLINVMAMYM